MTRWSLGRDASGNSYHLMLPPTAPGATFSAELVSEFGPKGVNGNWQNPLT